MNAGSKYVFDFMYPQYAGYLEAGAKAMISSEVLFTPTNFQPSFSFYGLTLSTGTMTSGLFGGPIFSIGSLGSFNFYFDPYSLAVAVTEHAFLFGQGREAFGPVDDQPTTLGEIR